jgi:hypothetical protein
MLIRTPMASTHFSPDYASTFTPLLSLVYTSASTHLMTEAELDALLMKSRERNSQLGLTGMLLYYDGAFIQVLEGPEENVRMLYTRIGQDPRHHRVIRLLEEYIPERNFPDWSMGYHRLKRADLEQIDGSMSFAEVDEFLNYFQTSPKRSMILLQSFLKSSRL